MEGVAQLVRASDCGSEGRGFESHHSPIKPCNFAGFFCLNKIKVLRMSGFLQIGQECS